jgi:alpha-galactosidase
VQEDLAAMMRTQIEIQDLVVRAALEKDPDLAFQAVAMDPLSPPGEAACRRMFDEMMRTQKHLLPFD